MRLFFYGLAGLVVLALAAVLVVPSLIDWNGYKRDIAEAVKAETGRDLVIDGALDLAMLPAPHLSAEGVRLSNLAGAASRDMARIKRLQVSVRLLPLIQGRVEVESVTLVEPVIELERLKDGRVNWEFAPTAAPALGAPASAAPAAAASGAGAAASFRLDRIAVADATVVWRDPDGTVERIEKANLDISAGALAGPFRINGTLAARGTPFTLEATIGALDGDSPVPIMLRLGLTGSGGRIEIGGTLADPRGSPRFDGRIKAEAEDVARVVRGLSGGATAALPQALARKLTLAAAVKAADRSAAIDGLDVELGDVRARGGVKLAWGDRTRADVTLAVNRVVLEPWLSSIAGAGPARAAAAKGAAKPAENQSAASAGFSLPAGVSGSLDLAVQLIESKSGNIRDARVAATLNDGEITLNRANARLPGDALVSLFGFFAAPSGKPDFDGTVEAEADNLRGVFEFLRLDVTRVPADRLRKFTLSTKVKGWAENLRLLDLDARLDASRLRGGAVVVLRDRLAMGVTLDIDRINLDGYLPPPGTGAATDKPAAPGGAAGAGPAAAEKSSGPLDGFDANLRAHIGALTWRAVPLQDVSFDGTLQAGALAIRDASVRDAAGTSAKLTGTVSKLDAKPEFTGDVQLDSRDLAAVAPLMDFDPASVPRGLGKVSLAGHAALDGRKLDLDAKITAAGGTVAVKGALDGLDAMPRAEFALEATHPSVNGLIRALGSEYRPADANIGAFRLAATAKGGLDGLDIAAFDAKAGNAEIAGTGRLAFATGRPKLTAKLTTGAIALDPFLPAAPPQRAEAAPPSLFVPVAMTTAQAGAEERWSRDKFDLTALDALDADVTVDGKALTWRNVEVAAPHLVASLDGRVLAITELSGRMFDGGFEAAGRLDARAIPSLTATVKADKANVGKALFLTGTVDLEGGVTDFEAEIAAAGESPHALVSALSGKGRLSARDGVVKGFDLPALSDRLKRINNPADLLVALGTGLRGGSTRFQSLDGTFTIDKGVLRSDDLKLAAQAGAGAATGTVDLPRWLIDANARFWLTEHKDAPPIGVRLDGPLDGPRQIILANEIQDYFVQRGMGALIRKAIPQPASPAPAPAPSADQAPAPPAAKPAKPDPKDLLRGLLEGLTK